jgi:SAM-dependent methyltransferase
MATGAGGSAGERGTGHDAQRPDQPGPAAPAPPAPPRRDGYVYGGTYATAYADAFARRTAAAEAAFFLPHLRPGMRLLDAGCGPGGITLGLAEAVATGEVVGVDAEAAQVARAQALAAEHGARRVRFQTASVYALPFPDASFDAVFFHQVLQHLREPDVALAEAHRVLTRGGVVGVRDSDWGSTTWWPSDPLVEQLLTLFQRWQRHHGGDPQLGRRLRRLLREAGFGRIAASASVAYVRLPEADARIWPLAETDFGRGTIALGWTDGATLERLAAARAAQVADPDRFEARLACEAVGWRD